MFLVSQIAGLFQRKKVTSQPILKYLAQTEGRRAGAIPVMKSEDFNSIRDDIERIVQSFLPSGYNGKLAAMASAIQGYFQANGIDSELYWTEVWIRGGRKAMDNYNGRQLNSAQ